MEHRPSVMDRMVAMAARLHAERVFRQFIRATRTARRLQEQILLQKIARNAHSQFGRDFHFDRISDYASFTRCMPILTYEEHRPYVERVKAGDPSAMFGRGQSVRMFALTSGTTRDPKYIPVTDAFLAEYRQGWNAFGVKAILDHPGSILRKIVQVSSRMDEQTTSAGIACGAITGLIAATQKRLVRKYYVSPACLSLIDDPLAKYYTVMRLAVPEDVAFCITASPATQLKLARTADEHGEQLIRDIHEGTLWSELPVPPAIRDELKPRLFRDKQTARYLENLLSEHGRLLPQHYWNLGFLANWTGGTMGLYLRDFPEFFGQTPVRDVGLMASEGRMSLPIEDGTSSGILEVMSHFFEFIPRDCIEQENPSVFRCDELEVNQEYFILLTTSSGLYRYHIGDVVRVTGYEGQAPLIAFLNKGDHTCSLTGEKLTENQVILAMKQAGDATGIAVSQFILAPRWDHPPFYRLHAEQPTNESAMKRLADELDRQLQHVNMEYAGKRQSQRLQTVQFNRLPSGFLAKLDAEQASRHRRGNEQYKHQYLYCQPGQDRDFPPPCPNDGMPHR